MDVEKLTERELAGFARRLREEEYAGGSIELYLRSARKLAAWLGERRLEKAAVLEWKDSLLAEGLSPATVNSMLAAVNRLFRFLDREDCRVRAIKIQKALFRSETRDLSREEYLHLVETAEERGQKRLALLLETVCSTGIRVSELRYVTVEAAREGRTDVSLKGKLRTILLPPKLCRKLLKYARRQKLNSGELFRTRSGGSLSRKQIWAELKALSKKAGISAAKVFPHNLRHLFAKTFYRAYRDISKLADILGHSSIETTRIYLLSTGLEHARQMSRLGLVR